MTSRQMTIFGDKPIVGKLVTEDPRPDLQRDSILWNHLLARTAAIHGTAPDSVVGVLHGVRCQGASLDYDGQRVKIVKGEYPSDELWEEHRTEYLMPHRDTIGKLLAQSKARAAMSLRASR